MRTQRERGGGGERGGKRGREAEKGRGGGGGEKEGLRAREKESVL